MENRYQFKVEIEKGGEQIIPLNFLIRKSKRVKNLRLVSSLKDKDGLSIIEGDKLKSHITNTIYSVVFTGVRFELICLETTLEMPKEDLTLALDEDLDLTMFEIIA